MGREGSRIGRSGRRGRSLAASGLVAAALGGGGCWSVSPDVPQEDATRPAIEQVPLYPLTDQEAVIGGTLTPAEPRRDEPSTAPLADLIRTSREATAGAYRFYPGDRFRFQVYDNPELTTEARVPLEGAVTFPLVGDTPVLGRTIPELTEALTQALEARFFTSAQVHIQVIEFAARKAYILGSVVRPSAYDLSPEMPMTLLQLVSEAGGFTDEADRERLRVIRRIDGEPRLFVVDATDIEEGRLDLDVVLLAGDQVVVPELPRIYVLGAVTRPGGFPFSFQERMTVAKAVGLGGGFAPGSDPDRITLIRDDGTGQRVYVVNFGALTRNRNIEANVLLQPNDTLIVPERDRIYVLGQVGHAGAFDLGESGLTVTRAVALAGGFTRIASVNSTVLVRETSEGRRSYTIPVDSIINGPAPDVRLLPGDIIFVPESVF